MRRSTHIVLCLLFIFTTAMAAEVKEAAATGLKAPVLESPLENTTFENVPNETTLAWKPVPSAATYYVTWVYRSSTKGQWSVPTVSPAISGNENTSYTFDAPSGDGEYEWYVTAYDSTGTFSSPPSLERTFFFKSTLALQSPKLISPQQNTHFENVPQSATLVWQQVPGASGYKVDLQYKVGNSWEEDATDGFQVSVTGQESSFYTFTFTLPIGLPTPVECQWRVQATGPDNTVSAYSGWQKFEFQE